VVAVSLKKKYDRVMQAARQWVEYQEYTRDDSEAYKNIGNAEWEEFWVHYEAVAGTTVDSQNKGNFFTCSC